MYTAEKRILTAFALLLVFAAALYLRFYGLDWAFKDGAFTFHPDENHVQSCVNSLRPQFLTPEEQQLPLGEQLQLLYERNLKVDPAAPYTPGTPGLRPVNYNYGTLPNHLYLGYKTYLVDSYIEPEGEAPGEWVLLNFPDALSWFALAFALWLGLWMYIALCRDLKRIEGRTKPWYEDPRRMFFFMPCMLLPLLGLFVTFAVPHLALDFSKYNPATSNVLIVGRTVTAFLGAFTVLLVYLIGRYAYNGLAGLIGAAFLAFAMLHVQSSHFATVDIILAFFATAAGLGFLRVAQSGALFWYALGAAAAGCAVATKWSGLLLIAPFFAAQGLATYGKADRAIDRWIHLFWLALSAIYIYFFIDAARSIDPPLNVTLGAYFGFIKSNLWWIAPIHAIAFIASLYLIYLRLGWEGRKRGWLRDAWRVYKPWVWFKLAVVAGAAVFFIGQPMAYFDAQRFASDVAVQAAYNSTGERPIWFTLQFNNTVPVFTSLDNLFFPSLDWFTAFFVVIGCLYALWSAVARKNIADAYLCAFVFPLFLVLSSAHSKYPRYLLMVLPVMAALGGRFLVDAVKLQPGLFAADFAWRCDGLKKSVRALACVAGAAALIGGAAYGYSYVRIYDEPHTLIQARNYLMESMRPGEQLFVNNVDESIGVAVTGDIGFHYAEPPGTDYQLAADYYADKLDKADWIAFRSKRPYGSTLANPDRYPAINHFLRVLFAEQAGFRVDKVITSSPTVLGWEFRYDKEDETARVYDHPKVILFKKNQDFDREQLKEIILNPPDWVNSISGDEILTLRDGRPVYQPEQTYPLLRWWAAMLVLGAIGFLLLFPLTRHLPDGGYGIAKAAGLLAFSWLVWLIASIQLAPVSGVLFIIVFLGLAGTAGLSAWVYRAELSEFIRSRLYLLIGIETLFIVIWILFLAIRAWHPAISWGEKPMNFSFINAVYHTDYFPPEDPWISGEHVNYYYFGHMLFSLAGRAAGLAPEYFFNIGGTSIAALCAAGIFSLIFAMCRHWVLGLLGVYLYLFSTHLLAFFQHVRYAINPAQPGQSATLSECIAALGSIASWLWLALKMYTGLANDADRLLFSQFDQHDAYDKLSWASRSVLAPNHAANEYPYWTQLFLDFHAHMMVVPFSIAFLYVLYALFRRPKAEIGGGLWSGYIGWLALLFGAVTCINTWDMPGLGIALALALAVKFQRESPIAAPDGPYLEWTAQSTWLSVLRFPVAPLALTLLASYVAVYPFHYWFVARVSGVGIMTEGQTSMFVYVFWWGHLLFPIALAALLIACIRRDGAISLKRSALFVIGYALSIALALLISRTNPLGFPPTMTPGDPPLDYTVVGVFLPFLAVLFFALWNRRRCSDEIFALLIAFVGLGLSLGIELLYIKEGWTRPRHRWNTAFKFNLQTWLYFSIAAPMALLIAWRIAAAMGQRIGAWFKWSARGGFTLAYAVILASTIPATLLMPLYMMHSRGGIWRDGRGERPTLDGLAWLKTEHYPDYAAVQWLKRYADGAEPVVEMPDGYYNQVSRFSTLTGMPAILGWSHHVGERMHRDKTEQRRRDADRVYLSPDPDEVESILNRYGVQYVLFGDNEMNYRRDNWGRFVQYGQPALERLLSHKDVLDVVFHYENTMIFKPARNFNDVFAYEPPPEMPPALMPKQSGYPLLQGGRGSGNGEFSEPRGLAADGRGNIYVADTFNHRIQVFEHGGAYLWKAGERGDGDNELNEPNAIDIDPDTGAIYIADTWNWRVVMLDPNGQFIGATPNLYYGPRGIAWHPGAKRVYISDTGHHQIQVIEAFGEPVETWGAPGGGEGDNDFREPVGIDVAPGGEVVIADTRNLRVKIHSPEGELIDQWPIQSAYDGAAGLESHIAVTSDERVVLTDPFEATVHVYSMDGELLGKIDRDLDGNPLRKPVGVLVHPDGRVFVTDIPIGDSRIRRVQ